MVYGSHVLGTIPTRRRAEHIQVLGTTGKGKSSWIKYALAQDVARGHLKRWSTFSTPISRTSRLIPDAYAELHTPNKAVPVFVEVDLGTESLRIIHRKITAYIQLAVTGDFTRIFQQARFRVAILTPSLRRLDTIRHVVARETHKLFWFCVFAANPRHTFWERSWLRPSDAEIKTFL